MLNPINLFNQNLYVNAPKNAFPQTNPIKSGLKLNADIFEHSVSNISFTSVDDTKIGRAVRELGGVPCPYTGIPMINGKEISHLTKGCFEGPSQNTVIMLKPFEDRMHPVEKQVFSIIEGLSKENPNKNIRELLDTVRDEHLDNVKSQEYDILGRMYNVKLSNKNDRKNMDKLITESIDIIDKQDENYIFRRRRFMDKFSNITSKMMNKKEVAELTEIAEELPRAHDNADAFIVKFTQKDPKTKKEKTPYQLGMALLQSSVGSIEHIRPRHPQGGLPAGKDILSNYLYASRAANTGRKNMPLDEYVTKNPQVKENLQKHIDAVIDKINAGEVMQDYKAYPILVAKTVEDESKGLVVLDTSNLKVSKKEIKETMDKAGLNKPAKPNKPVKPSSVKKPTKGHKLCLDA